MYVSLACLASSVHGLSLCYYSVVKRCSLEFIPLLISRWKEILKHAWPLLNELCLLAAFISGEIKNEFLMYVWTHFKYYYTAWGMMSPLLQAVLDFQYFSPKKLPSHISLHPLSSITKRHASELWWIIVLVKIMLFRTSRTGTMQSVLITNLEVSF